MVGRHSLNEESKRNVENSMVIVIDEDIKSGKLIPLSQGPVSILMFQRHKVGFKGEDWNIH